MINVPPHLNTYSCVSIYINNMVFIIFRLHFPVHPVCRCVSYFNPGGHGGNDDDGELRDEMMIVKIFFRCMMYSCSVDDSWWKMDAGNELQCTISRKDLWKISAKKLNCLRVCFSFSRHNA